MEDSPDTLPRSRTVSDLAFPPVLAHEESVLAVFSAFKSVVRPMGAWYVSTPITTGRRFAAARTHPGLNADMDDEQYREFMAKHVIGPNRLDADRFVDGLRNGDMRLVINPSSLEDVDDWSQGDYLALWKMVIGSYVSTLVFMDGWEYSRGCAFEFLVATALTRSTLKQSLEPLHVTEAVAALERAIAEEREGGVSADFHMAVLEELKSIASDLELQ